VQFGNGSTSSPERALHAAFEAANGIQLGLDVAWDLFLALGTVLLAWNMWHHPRFGRILAVSGIVIAVALVIANLIVFPEPPGNAGSIDLGSVIGLWYLIVTVRLAMSGRWAAAHEAVDARVPVWPDLRILNCRAARGRRATAADRVRSPHLAGSPM
jgi:hypothetical protein